MEGGVSRDELIQLMLCQLSEYGFSNLSQAIATHTKVPMTADSNSRLAELVRLGLQSERGRAGAGAGAGAGADEDAGAGAELRYQERWRVGHKGAATAAAFSGDGRYVATGAADASLKLIDVDRARDGEAVLRTLHHGDGGSGGGAVTGVAFHPNGLVLASCSADQTLRLFDLSAAHGRASFQGFRDSHALRSLAFHPSGDYIAAGGDGPEVRLYAVRTGDAYLLPPGPAQHAAGIAHVTYSGSGAAIASASRDGAVRIWDGASGRCVQTIARAHGGEPATSVAFARDGRHVLSAGLDSAVRLWDASSGRLVREYAGADVAANAVFSHDAALVLAPDAAASAVAAWDAASGRLLGRIAGGSQRVTWVAASPAAAGLVACSADGGVSCWDRA
ncbi:hypothetical protein H4R18_003807 [Coemansia javaensis]|uniref:Cleavage stimulation factor 50 kDa subunit n=1 Tax=Coemansia javaensis TaxID=2761396 RepID=A0A9W8LH44_9FUNG|nr:hypothetical protein H4R18_003807 [Coemansia javaensis]